MINILPDEARASLTFDYRLRLAALICREGVLFCAVAAVLLLPAYLNVEVARRAASDSALLAHQALLRRNLADSAAQEDDSLRLLTAAEGKLHLQRPSPVLALLMGARPAGVSVTGIQYQSEGDGAQVQISGTAQTRDLMLGYKQALAKVAGVAAVDLPASYLVNATNAPFTMTVSYAP